MGVLRRSTSTRKALRIGENFRPRIHPPQLFSLDSDNNLTNTTTHDRASTMGKKPKEVLASSGGTSTSSSSRPEPAMDPVLSSLFASSSGPVKAPKRPVIKSNQIQKATSKAVAELPTPDDTLSESEHGSDREDAEPGESNVDDDRPRKRRKVQEDDLEDVYFRKLAKEEQRDLQQSRGLDDNASEVSDSPSNDLEDLSDEDETAAVLPMHESLSGANDVKSADKDNRTIFLANVSTSAIKSKSDKKILLTHLESALPSDPPSKIESIRFRSTAYAPDTGPKKAGFATKALMDSTASSTNAYVVLTTSAAARTITSKLNGTIVLDRHLHVDNVGAPAPTDHRRCVFIGNLPFVDEETLETPTEDNPRNRPKAKQRADAEEGLWRVFGKVGKVESVRMVRDKATRVGKGFAYVQFTDENAVEKALLMNDKKFAPHLPRKLRVMRAKKENKRTSKHPERKTVRGNDKSAGGRGRTVQKHRSKEAEKKAQRGFAALEGAKKIVFEGYRATKPDGKEKKGDGKKQRTRPQGRSAKRGASFKASGGKKKRDLKK